MKTTIVDEPGRADARYAALVGEGLMELKRIKREILRSRANTEHLRAESGRIMKETWKTLRRVEATL